MNSKLSVWASVAEIVSGVAVPLTLVVLTISLRDYANTTRTVVYQQLLGSLNQQNTVVLQDGELPTNGWRAA